MGRALHNQTTPTHLGCSPFLVTDHCDSHQQSRHHHHHIFAQVPKIKIPHFPPFFSLLFLCSFHTVLQIGRHSTCGLAYKFRFTHHTNHPHDFVAIPFIPVSLRLNQWPCKPSLAYSTSKATVNLEKLSNNKQAVQSATTTKLNQNIHHHYDQACLTRLPMLGARLVLLFGRDGPSSYYHTNHEVHHYFYVHIYVKGMTLPLSVFNTAFSSQYN